MRCMFCPRDGVVFVLEPIEGGAIGAYCLDCAERSGFPWLKPEQAKKPKRGAQK